MEGLSSRSRTTIKLLGGGVILIILLVTTVYWQPLRESRQQTSTLAATPTKAAVKPATTPAPAPAPAMVEPAKDFLQRVTKKPFGIYVTPTDSPVQPERFTGYHTGADGEYGDITADVPVY